MERIVENSEALFVGTAEKEHVEMYLKAIWWLDDMNKRATVSSIARVLNVKQPSVVQMLKKLNDLNLVIYKRGCVKLTEKGYEIGKRMVRNSRLLEVMMKNALKIDIDEEIVCGIEHHMNDKFADALCSLLNHPDKCPHGYSIPRGECCNNAKKYVRV